MALGGKGGGSPVTVALECLRDLLECLGGWCGDVRQGGGGEGETGEGGEGGEGVWVGAARKWFQVGGGGEIELFGEWLLTLQGAFLGVCVRVFVRVCVRVCVCLCMCVCVRVYV